MNSRRVSDVTRAVHLGVRPIENHAEGSTQPLLVSYTQTPVALHSADLGVLLLEELAVRFNGLGTG